MRRLIIIPLLLITLILSAEDWYVAPPSEGGSDGNSGADIAHPWASWHYAFNNTPGSDTCYFRGGVYLPYSVNYGARLEDESQDGTRLNPTCFFAYPTDWAAGDYPILDCNTMTITQYGYGVYFFNCNNIKVKGLTVRHVRQRLAGYNNFAGFYAGVWTGGDSNSPNNITYENCVSHNIGNAGFSWGGDTAYYTNCDAYICCDSLPTGGDPGGNGNGFSCGVGNKTVTQAKLGYVHYKGCRTWLCSDQGWAITTAGTAVFDSCWAIGNGNMPFTGNIGKKGSGWKLWYYNVNWVDQTKTQIIMRNCIAAHNAWLGISWTDAATTFKKPRAHIYNCFSYSNGGNYPALSTTYWGAGFYDPATTDTTGYWDRIYRNNISYDNYGYSAWNPGKDHITGIYDIDYNKFNYSNSTISDYDFIGLDTAGMTGNATRQADFSLPEVLFGHLASASECVDGGTDVGLPYDGAAPDIGWAEYAEQDPPVDPTLATLSTYDPYWTSPTTASTGGFVSDNGGGTVSARGVCWNTTGNPDTGDSKTTNGSGDGAFTSTMIGLTQFTTYYVRAYATNEAGTAYGEQMTFRTSIIKHSGKVIKHLGKFIIID